MKYIILIISIISILGSAELLTINKKNKTYSFCVKNYFIKNNVLFYKKSNSNQFTKQNLQKIISYKFEAGYIFENNKCFLNNKSISNYFSHKNKKPTYNNLSQLGLSQNDFNFLMSLSGILSSFLFLYGLFRWL